MTPIKHEVFHSIISILTPTITSENEGFLKIRECSLFLTKSPGHSSASTLQNFDVSSTYSCQTTRMYESKAAVMKFNLIFRPRFIKFARTFNIFSPVKGAEGCRIRLSLSKYFPSFSNFRPLKLKSTGGEGTNPDCRPTFLVIT